MKKLLLALALAAPGLAAHAQAPVATTAAAAAAARPAAPLGQLVQDVTHLSTPAALPALAAQLSQVAAQAPTDWLPRYYQAYALIEQARLSQLPGAAKDHLLDQADALLAQAQQLRGDASELLALQALSYQVRLVIDPMQRGQEYAELVDATLAQAKAANPANPRPYLLEANQTYYTPAEYGGGAEQARPLYQAAKAKFEAFRPASALAPSWGQGQVLRQLSTYATAAK